MSIQDIASPKFILKFIVIILGWITDTGLYGGDVYYNIRARGYHYSYMTVLVILMIGILFFESQNILEAALLVSVLVKVCLILFIFIRSGYNTENSGYIYFLVLNIVSIVLLVIDISLTAKNKTELSL